jgi:hypothetical protein
LSVAAVDAERMQFHQFTCVVFIGMTFLVGLVVEIDHHRWRMRRCPHKVAEIAERIFADHFAVIHGFEEELFFLVHEDVEMVAPEFDHYLVELTLAVKLTKKCCLTQFVRDFLAVVTIEELIADAFEFVGFHG